ncbi:MAG: DNA alkylation repair protein [Bacteroidales bacterium]
MSTTAKEVRETLTMFADPAKAKILSGFFKTGKGQYGEGDRFLGIRVPDTRSVAKEARSLPLAEISVLLEDPYHEVRLCGFLVLVDKYRKTKLPEEKEALVNFYLAHARKANNWDLVDLSAPKILGDWLRDKERTILYELAQSDSLWEQRIAMVSTWTIIRQDDFDDTLRLVELLMDHPHDLMRKAVGWMLREVGKRDRETLTRFLEAYATRLSRTSLRYAIEHYPPEARKRFMNMGK